MKQGIVFGLENLIKLLVAVFVITLLIILSVALWQIFAGNNDEARSQEEVENLAFELQKLSQENPTSTYKVLRAPEGWYIRSFPNGERCNGNAFCLCMCNTLTCDAKISCTETDKFVSFSKARDTGNENDDKTYNELFEHAQVLSVQEAPYEVQIRLEPEIVFPAQIELDKGSVIPSGMIVVYGRGQLFLRFTSEWEYSENLRDWIKVAEVEESNEALSITELTFMRDIFLTEITNAQNKEEAGVLLLQRDPLNFRASDGVYHIVETYTQRPEEGEAE